MRIAIIILTFLVSVGIYSQVKNNLPKKQAQKVKNNTPPPPKKLICTFEKTEDKIVNVPGRTPGEEPVYNGGSVDLLPQYPDGLNELYKLINTKINKPEIRANVKSVRVFITLIIEKDGSLSNIEVIRDPEGNLGTEIIKVLYDAPKWKPGELNGNFVRVQYTLPIPIYNDNWEDPDKP